MNWLLQQKPKNGQTNEGLEKSKKEKPKTSKTLVKIVNYISDPMMIDLINFYILLILIIEFHCQDMRKPKKKKVEQPQVEGLNLDLLLSSYKDNFNKETPLDPLVVLSDDEDINDYMDHDDAENNKTDQHDVKENKTNPESAMMDLEDDSIATESVDNEEDGKATGLILPLMMVSKCNII